MARPLLVVDVQQGFINDFTRHIPDRVRRLLEAGDFEPVLLTRFVNGPESPYTRLLKWDGCSQPPLHETYLAAPRGDPTPAPATPGRH